MSKKRLNDWPKIAQPVRGSVGTQIWGCWIPKPGLLPTGSYHSRANLVSASEVTTGSASVASQRRWRGCSKERPGWAFLIPFGNKGDCRGKKKWPDFEVKIEGCDSGLEPPKVWETQTKSSEDSCSNSYPWWLFDYSMCWTGTDQSKLKTKTKFPLVNPLIQNRGCQVTTLFLYLSRDTNLSVPSYSLPLSSHLTIRGLWLIQKLPALTLQASGKHLVFAQQL